MSPHRVLPPGTPFLPAFRPNLPSQPFTDLSQPAIALLRQARSGLLPLKRREERGALLLFFRTLTSRLLAHMDSHQTKYDASALDGGFFGCFCNCGLNITSSRQQLPLREHQLDVGDSLFGATNFLVNAVAYDNSCQNGFAGHLPQRLPAFLPFLGGLEVLGSAARKTEIDRWLCPPIQRIPLKIPWLGSKETTRQTGSCAPMSALYDVGVQDALAAPNWNRGNPTTGRTEMFLMIDALHSEGASHPQDTCGRHKRDMFVLGDTNESDTSAAERTWHELSPTFGYSSSLPAGSKLFMQHTVDHFRCSVKVYGNGKNPGVLQDFCKKVLSHTGMSNCCVAYDSVLRFIIVCRSCGAGPGQCIHTGDSRASSQDVEHLARLVGTSVGTSTMRRVVPWLTEWQSVGHSMVWVPAPYGNLIDPHLLPSHLRPWLTEGESIAHSMSEAITRADALRLQGNSGYVEGQYDAALQKYTEAIELLCCGIQSVEDALLIACLSNRAACAYQLHEYRIVIHDSTWVLQMSPHHAKALMRRSFAHESLEQYAHALSDMASLLSFAPSLRVVEFYRRLVACNSLHQAHVAADRWTSRFHQWRYDTAPVDSTAVEVGDDGSSQTAAYETSEWYSDISALKASAGLLSLETIYISGNTVSGLGTASCVPPRPTDPPARRSRRFSLQAAGGAAAGGAAAGGAAAGGAAAGGAAADGAGGGGEAGEDSILGVDPATSGHYARFGEPAPPNLGVHAGTRLGTRRAVG